METLLLQRCDIVKRGVTRHNISPEKLSSLCCCVPIAIKRQHYLTCCRSMHVVFLFPLFREDNGKRQDVTCSYRPISSFTPFSEFCLNHTLSEELLPFSATDTLFTGFDAATTPFLSRDSLCITLFISCLSC